MHVKEAIETGQTFLGIELGSTRIKAVLIDETGKPLASGGHSWENRLEDGVWTYHLEDVWHGIQESYKNLVSSVQEKYGVEASSRAVENFFAALAASLAKDGTERFIVAGGETSGIVTKALGVQGFYIGPAIAPGVPWVRSINNLVSLTLKSGNFGQEDFFVRAQENFPV